MTEFTEEQELEIKERIQKAAMNIASAQQWAIAGDRFYRLGLIAAAASVQQGGDDPYISEVGQILYGYFKEANGLVPKKPVEKPKE